MELANGTPLQGGKYKIEETLGQGSFGITYLARAEFATSGRLGTMTVEAKVAIKEFFMSDVNTRRDDGSTVDGSTGSVFVNYREKFRKEAKHLAKLSHSNIVNVFDVFDENGTTYYVMKFLDGKNLDDYIKQCGRLQESEAIEIIKEVGGAVSYMHSQKMLHLDIKPKNVMHCNDSKNYLIDFGLSKHFSDDGEPESSTTVGLGTPGYAPLEQSQYQRDGSFPATLDVYALGATMLKMLTGKRPPEASTILNSGFPYADLKNLGVSKATIDVLAMAMNPKKSERWPTIDEFLKNLPQCDDECGTIIEKPGHPTPKKTENTLVSVWKSRNIVTNLVCVAGISFFLFLNFLIAADHNVDSVEFSLALGLVCLIVGIIHIMHGDKKFIFAPIAIFAICSAYSCAFEIRNLSPCLLITAAYLIVISSLFLKKNGRTAYSLLVNRKKRKKSEGWDKRFTVLTSLILLFLSIWLSSGIINDFGLENIYPIIGTIIGMLFIIDKMRVGAYLIPFFLIIGYTNSFVNNLIPVSLTILYIIELLALFFIKKDNKSAWSVMR